MKPTAHHTITHTSANHAVHLREAADFDLLHPELNTDIERTIIEQVIRHLQHNNEQYDSLHILDIACGTGRLSMPFLEQGFTVTSCDLSSEMLAVFQNKVNKRFDDRSIIQQGNIAKLLKAKERYDCVIMGAFLHHIPDVQAFMQAVFVLVKPGGYIFVNHDPALRRIKRGAAEWVVEKIDSLLFQLWYLVRHQKYIPRIKEYGDADIHTKAGIDDEALLVWLQEQGCTVIDYQRYYSHKTRLATFLDKRFFKLLPQFFFFVQKGLHDET